MARPQSRIAPGWWDYTTIDPGLATEAARLTADDLAGLARDGFEVVFYDTLEALWLAEAMEYIEAWQQATPDSPSGICGPIGPTEHLPLVAKLVNELELDLSHAHFWGMDEWIVDGRPVDTDHPLSFEAADRRLCFDLMDPKFRIPDANLHFPKGDLAAFSASFDTIRCLVMQGGQGWAKHWAFNDPPKRDAPHLDEPPSPATYCSQGTRVVELHPLTVYQTAQMSSGGLVAPLPTHAATVGPVETFKAGRVSIYHPGVHDDPFGMRLTTLMISRGLADAAVPMSLLASHPHVRFCFYRPGIGQCDVGIARCAD